MDMKQWEAELAALLERRARMAMDLPEGKTRKKVFPTDAFQSILRDVHSVCEQLTRPRRVAFLGPAFSYTHEAARRLFGLGADGIPVSTILSIFEEVRDGQADFGVVPLENSQDGRVVDTLENLSRFPVTLCGEIWLPIQHVLMAKCRRSEIVAVQSKAQALSQCRHWMEKHLPGIPLIEANSSAAAAKSAQTKPGVAAVASPLAAQEYGLNILAESIADTPHNATRFVCFSAESNGTQSARTKHDKTMLLFELPHESGSLADALLLMKRHKINLTWIESFPISDAPGRYLFFVDLEGHASELRVRRALAALRKKTGRLEILGSYPFAE